MTKNNDATRALEAVDKWQKCAEIMMDTRHIDDPIIGECQRDIEIYKIIRTALQKSAQVDNEIRIKVLKEMGFEYQEVKDEIGTLLSHVIMHPTNKGFFVNHTNLMCAMQRIYIAVGMLERAGMKAQVDGLVKALKNSQEQFGLIYESLKGETTDDKTAMAYAFAEAGQEITYEALQQFSAREI